MRRASEWKMARVLRFDPRRGKRTKFRPRGVLLDLGLPGMSGLEVARRLRADATETGARLVAMTGHGSPEDIAHSRDAGFERPAKNEARGRPGATAS